MIETPGPDAAKAAWRKWAVRQWESIEPGPLSEQVVGHLSRFAPLLTAQMIMLYYPMGRELDVTPLLGGPGSAVMAATRTPPAGPLTLHRLGEGPLETHRYGFLQPTGDAVPLDPGEVDLALVPGLCFSEDGSRLGHGAGYFDEFLARVRPEAMLVGVAPSSLVVERLPRAPHDVPMTHLATEQGVSAL